MTPFRRWLAYMTLYVVVAVVCTLADVALLTHLCDPDHASVAVQAPVLGPIIDLVPDLPVHFAIYSHGTSVDLPILGQAPSAPDPCEEGSYDLDVNHVYWHCRGGAWRWVPYGAPMSDSLTMLPVTYRLGRAAPLEDR